VVFLVSPKRKKREREREIWVVGLINVEGKKQGLKKCKRVRQ
jgi:hypothetical protein